MRGWSLPLGKYFGVDVRVHALFALLLPFSMVMSSALGSTGARGIALWMLALAAVLVRQTGRGIATAWLGRSPDSLMLLPTGALPHASELTVDPARGERILGLAGPLANFFVGITLALLMYTATSHINLFERPWFTSGHLLRSAIWAQILLGGLNLLPAFPLDAGIVLRRQLQRIRGEKAGAKSAAGISQAVAFILLLAGLLYTNAWAIIAAFTVLVVSRADAQTAVTTAASGGVTVGDVMLTDWTTLSASDTLVDAVARSARSLQDVFPVQRGPLLVGSISRNKLAEALRADGNGYVQGAMTRTLEVTDAGAPLVATLRRIAGRPGAQLLPVLSDGQVVGIVTPGNLATSMTLLGRSERAKGTRD